MIQILGDRDIVGTSGGATAAAAEADGAEEPVCCMH